MRAGARASVEEGSEAMPVADYCQRDVRTIDVEATLREAAQRMAEEGVGSLVAVQREHPRALLTDRDLALLVLREGLDPDVVRVGDALSHDPVVVHADAPLRAAAALMRRRAVRRLPVVDERQRLVGVIAFDDLLGLVARELSGIADAVAAQSPSPRPPERARAADSGPEVE
jgi:CBS domain-containing protein